MTKTYLIKKEKEKKIFKLYQRTYIWKRTFMRNDIFITHITPIKIRNIRNCIFVKYICNKNIVKCEKNKERGWSYRLLTL